MSETNESPALKEGGGVAERIRSLRNETHNVLALLVVAAQWPEAFPERRVTVKALLDKTRYHGGDETNAQHGLDRALGQLASVLPEAVVRSEKRGRLAGYALAQPHDHLLDDWLYESGHGVLTTECWRGFLEFSAADTPAYFWDVLAGMIESVAKARADAHDCPAALSLLDDWLALDLDDPELPGRLEQLLDGLGPDLLHQPLRVFSLTLKGLVAVGLPRRDSPYLTGLDPVRFRFILGFARIEVQARGARSKVALLAAQDSLSRLAVAAPARLTFHDRLILARIALNQANCLMALERFRHRGEPNLAEHLERLRAIKAQVSAFEFLLPPADRAALYEIDGFLTLAMSVNANPDDALRASAQAFVPLARAFRLYQIAGSRAGQSECVLMWAGVLATTYLTRLIDARGLRSAALYSTLVSGGFSKMLGCDDAAGRAGLLAVDLLCDRIATLDEAADPQEAQWCYGMAKLLRSVARRDLWPEQREALDSYVRAIDKHLEAFSLRRPPGSSRSNTRRGKHKKK